MASAAQPGRTEALRQGRRLSPRPITIDPAAAAAAPDAKRAKARYHAMDALRGMAMFLVIGLHAALGYIERDIPTVLWCVRDAPTLPLFDWFCWWCMGVSNPLYFTIAGFFAVHLYESRGPRGFMASRARRVLVPFVVGVLTIGPACLFSWSCGWLLMGRCTLKQVLRLRFTDPQLQSEILGPGHLWFLEYLLLMLALFGLARRLGERRAAGLDAFRTVVDRVVGSSWRPLLLALPTTVLLWISRYRVGIDAVLDRHNSFLPDPVKFLHHASFFVIGAGLYRMRHDLARLARVGPLYLALSVPIFVGRAWLLDRDATATLHGPSTLALAALGALFGWLVVFGFIGVFLRVFRESRPSILYLADSSYWIYLVHMPVLGLIQVDLFTVPGHALWKFPVVLASTLALGFASYQTLVRHTWVGERLHGRRARPSAPGIG
jgi:glucans biosynthesis protein C